MEIKDWNLAPEVQVWGEAATRRLLLSQILYLNTLVDTSPREHVFHLSYVSFQSIISGGDADSLRSLDLVVFLLSGLLATTFPVPPQVVGRILSKNARPR